MATLKRFSHYFQITNLDNRTRQVVERFIAQKCTRSTLKQVGWSNGRPVLRREPGAQFALAMPAGDEYRLHINQYQEFIDYTKGDKLFTSFDIIDVPLYEPYRCTFKLFPKWQIRTHQVPLVKYMVEDTVNDKPARQRAAIMQTGLGKLQPLYSKIKVPGGWKLMGDMKVGDTVTAYDGTPSKVVGVFPQGMKPVYRITFADGRSAEAGLEHLWRVYRNVEKMTNCVRKTTLTPFVITTKELISLLNSTNQNISKRLYIDLPESEQIPDIDLPVDPWLVGALLGDGYLGKTISITTSDDFIVTKVNSKLPPGLEFTHSYRYSYTLKTNGNKNILKEDLKKLDLLNKTALYKFIPREYLYASHGQRLELMRGLLDTDGTMDREGGGINYSTSSEQLAKDVQYLARSLGCHAKVTSRIPKYTYKGEKKEGQLAYRVFIRTKTPKDLFSLPRQKERAPTSNQYSDILKLRVEKVELSGYEECQCIAIDHPEHLYITDDFVVTHNTASALFAVEKLGVRTLLVLKSGYVQQWARVVKDTFKNFKAGDLMVVSGTKQLVSLMNLQLSGELTAKFIIISNKTFQMYLQDYITKRHSLEIYPIHVDEFYEKMGIGLRINDEVHMHFHFNYMQDLFSHLPRSVGLTATLTPDEAFMDRMYKTMFPEDTRFKGIPYRKYAHAVSLNYKLNNPKEARYKQKGMGSYNHIVYEHWLIKNKDRLRNYISIIDKVVEFEYASKRVAGEKMLVFASSIDLCTILHEHYKRKYPNLKVNRYVEDDPFSNLLEADLCISNLLSSGTAVDIPGLVRVLMTTALGSSQLNEQAFGRLRNIKTDSGLRFIWLTCTNISQHNNYDRKKKFLLKDKAVSINTYDINIKV